MIFEMTLIMTLRILYALFFTVLLVVAVSQTHANAVNDASIRGTVYSLNEDLHSKNTSDSDAFTKLYHELDQNRDEHCVGFGACEACSDYVSIV